MAASEEKPVRYPIPPMLLGIGCVVVGYLLNDLITIRSADADAGVRAAVAAEVSPAPVEPASAAASGDADVSPAATPQPQTPTAAAAAPEIPETQPAAEAASSATTAADGAPSVAGGTGAADDAGDVADASDGGTTGQTDAASLDTAGPAANLEPPHDDSIAGPDSHDGDDSGNDSGDDMPELEYVASLTPSGASLPEGLDDLEPGTLTRLTWHASESLYGASIPTPVLVAEGTEPGPTLCVTAAVHGDEINGIETVRQLMYSINPERLKGRLIGVPIVNIQAFERHSRYLPDRRDLNRYFPGNPTGSSASRIANSFFENVVRRCDALVDLHTGSFHRTNLPQLRADLDHPKVVEITKGFGSTVILHNTGSEGTLRVAAVAAGIPAVTLEAGEPLRIDEKAVKHSTKSLLTLMDELGMYKNRSFWGNPEPTYYSSRWVRANTGGMLLGEAKLGRRVNAGDLLGYVVDPITNTRQALLAPEDGRIIGMALNQFVIPGSAAYHIGIEAPSVEDLENQPRSQDPELDHSVADLDVDDMESGQDLSE
jgi:predicted deacylase